MEIAETKMVNVPVAPKVLPRGNSHIPAKNWARPPEKHAMPTTTLGVWISLAFTLYRERMNVVDANENRPLRSGKRRTVCRDERDAQSTRVGDLGWPRWRNVGLIVFWDKLGLRSSSFLDV